MEDQMDPDANLEEMRSLVGELVDDEFEVDSDKVMRLAEQWTIKARVLRD
jgi:hypothetical protein